LNTAEANERQTAQALADAEALNLELQAELQAATDEYNTYKGSVTQLLENEKEAALRVLNSIPCNSLNVYDQCNSDISEKFWGGTPGCNNGGIGFVCTGSSDGFCVCGISTADAWLRSIRQIRAPRKASFPPNGPREYAIAAATQAMANVQAVGLTLGVLNAEVSRLTTEQTAAQQAENAAQAAEDAAFGTVTAALAALSAASQTLVTAQQAFTSATISLAAAQSDLASVQKALADLTAKLQQEQQKATKRINALNGDRAQYIISGVADVKTTGCDGSSECQGGLFDKFAAWGCPNSATQFICDGDSDRCNCPS